MPEEGNAPEPSSLALSSEGDAPPETNDSLYRIESNGRFQQVCADLDGKITAFLGTTTDDTVLRGVQEQTRISVGVVEEALKRYQYA